MMILVSLGFLACGGESKKPLGAACDQDTVCEGLCLLSLPGGMCAHECDEQNNCEKGVCSRVSGGYYCLPACQGDEQCRVDEGYLCVVGACRTPVGMGDACARNEDCESQLSCVLGVCGVPCLSHEGCSAGLYCAEEGNQMACIPDDCTSGICSRTCQDHGECAEGTYCSSDGRCHLDICDSQGICEHPCVRHADCPEGTYCADVEGELHCVFVPEDLGPGTTGHSCTFDDCGAGYVCLEDGDEDPYAYCTSECSSALDCPPDMVCRETQNGEGELVDYCFKREYCEGCTFDDQCGFYTDRCVSSDPASAGGYCSAACDPTRPDTCPVDSTCLDAYFCESTGMWVSDCSQCAGNCAAFFCESTGTWVSDCTGCTGSCGPKVYQCFHDYGACIGDGSLCAPCQHNGQCTQGGFCLTSTSTGVSFCSEPCDSNNRCPEEFWCVSISGSAQCINRTGSCSAPSGGKVNCNLCESLVDCVSGSCVSFGGWEVCLDECTAGLGDCGPYTACQLTTDIHGLDWNLCVPQVPVDSCSELNTCLAHCPTGPGSCDGTAPDDCR